MKAKTAIVQVPATTANLGPGFDCLGIALQLYNRVRVEIGKEQEASLSPMVQETVDAFCCCTRKKVSCHISIQGEVPVSRGLGSSVTVRAGVIVGLNRLCGSPLTEAECLNLVIELEGHPDNAAPAFLGGFTVSTNETILHQKISSELKFVTLIPDVEIKTKAARKVLPKKVLYQDAVNNVRQAALISAAFASSKYELLQDAFQDRLHQPYRKKLLPILDQVIKAGVRAGALGGFLSGSGSTLIGVALQNHGKLKQIAAAMKRAAVAKGYSTQIKILSADNEGLKVTVR